MNFKCLIKVILNTLLVSVKDSLKTAETEFDRLIIWQSAIHVMEKIVRTIKKQDSRINLLIFVKVLETIMFLIFDNLLLYYIAGFYFVVKIIPI